MSRWLARCPESARRRRLLSGNLALCLLIAACQRPTQLLPPAPIFEMNRPLAASRGENNRQLTASSDAADQSLEQFSTIARVYFARGSAALSAEARAVLDRQADWLDRHRDMKASLVGHADAFGTREYQLALGERRAAAIKLYLTARGIAPGRLSVTSLGKQQPVATALDEKSQQMNRRGETVLIGPPRMHAN